MRRHKIDIVDHRPQARIDRHQQPRTCKASEDSWAAQVLTLLPPKLSKISPKTTVAAQEPTLTSPNSSLDLTEDYWSGTRIDTAITEPKQEPRSRSSLPAHQHYDSRWCSPRTRFLNYSLPIHCLFIYSPTHSPISSVLRRIKKPT